MGNCHDREAKLFEGNCADEKRNEQQKWDPVPSEDDDYFFFNVNKS